MRDQFSGPHPHLQLLSCLDVGQCHQGLYIYHSTLPLRTLLQPFVCLSCCLSSSNSQSIFKENIPENANATETKCGPDHMRCQWSSDIWSYSHFVIYIYIQRERERKRESVCVCVSERDRCFCVLKYQRMKLSPSSTIIECWSHLSLFSFLPL